MPDDLMLEVKLFARGDVDSPVFVAKVMVPAIPFADPELFPEARKSQPEPDVIEYAGRFFQQGGSDSQDPEPDGLPQTWRNSDFGLFEYYEVKGFKVPE